MQASVMYLPQTQAISCKMFGVLLDSLLGNTVVYAILQRGLIELQ